MTLITRLASLVKFRIALLSTLSAVTGFIVASGGFPTKLLLFIPGLFALAAGAAALNQYQERTADALMERTRNRPLPTGELKPLPGLLVAIGLILGGLSVLFLGFGAMPALLGTVTVVIYNGVYTYLKRKTAFAAIPGALTGALPPAIGWLAGNGGWNSPILIGLAVFFYIWQVPHFWLLLGIHGEEYRDAGFPVLTDIFSKTQLARITFTWVTATVCAGMLFPLFGMFRTTVPPLLLAVLALWVAVRSISLVRGGFPTAPAFRGVFIHINIFALSVMVMLIIDHGILRGQ